MKSSQIKNKEYWKQKIKSDIHRKNLKKEIFGDHYNLAAVRLNNNKKYFNEEIRIMEIEKSNRMLLEKIKKISERSKPRHIIERARTEVTENEREFIERSVTEERLKKNSLLEVKKQRYQSFETKLERSREKRNSSFNQNRTEIKKVNNNNEKLEDDKNRSYLYKGKKIIDKVLFKFKIFVEDGMYTILAKSDISEQKIEIPESHYEVLLKSELENNHKNIFRNFKLHENNKLQLFFKDKTKIEIDLVEKFIMELPLINKNLSLDTTTNI